jgi:hypothetical protein
MWSVQRLSRFLALGGGTHPCRGPRHRGLRLARNVGGQGIRGRRGRGESQRGPRATRGGLAQVGPPRARCPRAGPARTRPARGPRATRGGLARVGPPPRAVPDVFARARCPRAVTCLRARFTIHGCGIHCILRPSVHRPPRPSREPPTVRSNAPARGLPTISARRTGPARRKPV